MTNMSTGQELALTSMLLGIVLVPVTVVVLPVAGLVGAALRRRGIANRVFRWAAIVMCVLWLGDAALLGTGFVSDELRAWEYRRHHYELQEAAVMDGIPLAAGTRVSLAQDGRLTGFSVPAGQPVTLNGVRWTGAVELAGGDAVAGMPIDPVTRDGVPCAPGRSVSAWANGKLRACMLNADTEIGDVPCRGGNEVQMAENVISRVSACTLREARRFEEIACSSGAIEFYGTRLSRCFLAESLSRGSAVFPAGTKLHLTDGVIRLAQAPAAGTWTVDAMPLPPDTQVEFCADGAINAVWLPNGAQLPMGRGQLGGTIYFGCRRFESGSLAEPLLVDGEMIQRGESVGRKALGLD